MERPNRRRVGAPPVVDRLGPREAPAAAEILAHSFVGEPLFARLFQHTERTDMVCALRPWFYEWIRSFAPYGEIHTARRAGELAGVGIRMAPGVYPLTGWPKRVFALRLIKSVLRMRLTTRRAFELATVGDALAQHEPVVPFWHLAWVGVVPEHQRVGVGSALADEALRRIDHQPAPAWLTTFSPHTRRLYEKRGFVVESEVQPLRDGPVGWSMRREP